MNEVVEYRKNVEMIEAFTEKLLLSRASKNVPELALSVQQPHISGILWGKKKIEYRTTDTKVRGRIWLYESGSVPKVILGSVELVDTFFNEVYECWGWILKYPVWLDIPLEVVNHPQPRWWKPVFKQ